jgi:hypothetical protein
MQQRYYSPPPGPAPRVGAPPARPTVRRWDWDRRDPHGYIRMAIVFVGAFIGGFVVWPFLRGGHTDDGYQRPPTEWQGAEAPRRHLTGGRDRAR